MPIRPPEIQRAAAVMSHRDDPRALVADAHVGAARPGLLLGMLAIMLIWTLTSGCGRRREPPFVNEPSPDLAVTTLDQTDLNAVASVIQFQGTLLMGCDLAGRMAFSPPLMRMVEAVREQTRSRARDLDTLVRLKNAPAPESLGRQNSKLIDALEQSDPMAREPAFIDFFRTTHTDGLRLMRDMADRAMDPDVKAFASRQLSGITALLHHLDQVTETTP